MMRTFLFASLFGGLFSLCLAAEPAATGTAAPIGTLASPMIEETVAGPVQGSPAMQALLNQQAEHLALLQANAESDEDQQRIVEAKHQAELTRLDLLAREAEAMGRSVEAAAARAELARWQTPVVEKPLHWQERKLQEVQP